MAAANSSADTSAPDGSETHSGDGRDGKNLLEWGVVVVGVVITLGLIGFLVAQLVTDGGEPPALRVALGTPHADSSTVLVPIEVTNEGGLVASEVEVEVCGTGDACATVSFLYVPRRSSRKGQVGFLAPVPDSLEARIVSYVEP